MFCSIIVPTYNSDPDRLDQLLESIELQSLSRDQWEVIFVDDGSTSDILDHLEQIATTRANVTVVAMGNSGWPCRPRNEGVRRAQGDWVLFADHDDLLFPEALERLRSFAADLDVDVINPKEVRTRPWSWGWTAFTGDLPLVDDRGPLALLPMTPHKLYRRAFLLEHSIEFIEESRVFWEDVYFNVLAYIRGARTAVYSSYPIYHWVQTGENSSGNYGTDGEEFWAKAERLIEFFHSDVSDTADRNLLLQHWVQTRLIKLGGADAPKDATPARRLADFQAARAILERLVPREVDQLLSARDRGLTEFMRADDWPAFSDETARIEAFDSVVRASDFRWHDDALTFELDTTFVQGDQPASWKSDEPLLNAEVQLSMRGITSRESGPLHSRAPVVIDDGEPRSHYRASVALAELIDDRARADQRWEIAVRAQFPVRVTHHAVTVEGDEFSVMWALIDGHHVRVSRGKRNQLLVGVDVDTVVKSVENESAAIDAETVSALTALTVHLPDVSGYGSVELGCLLWLTPITGSGDPRSGAKRKVNAVIRARGGVAEIVSDAAVIGRGTFRLTVELNGAKRRLGVVQVHKSPAQQLAGVLLRVRRRLTRP